MEGEKEEGGKGEEDDFQTDDDEMEVDKEVAQKRKKVSKMTL